MKQTAVCNIPAPRGEPTRIQIKSVSDKHIVFSSPKGEEYLISRPKNDSWEGAEITSGAYYDVIFEDYTSIYKGEEKKYSKLVLID